MFESILFESSYDASLVAQQLYKVEQLDNLLFFESESFDDAALDLSAALAGVTNYSYWERSCRCRVPFIPTFCPEDVPRIYVVCLRAYRWGKQHGTWIDATQDPDDLKTEIDRLLYWSPADSGYPCQEWAIHDFENFQGIKLDECEDLETVSRLAKGVKECGEAFSLLASDYGKDATTELFQSAYLCTCSSRTGFVFDKLEEGELFQDLEKHGLSRHHLDLNAIAEAWFSNTHFSFEGKEGVHIFEY